MLLFTQDNRCRYMEKAIKGGHLEMVRWLQSTIRFSTEELCDFWLRACEEGLYPRFHHAGVLVLPSLSDLTSREDLAKMLDPSRLFSVAASRLQIPTCFFLENHFQLKQGL
jgi:hypothetical protein